MSLPIPSQHMAHDKLLNFDSLRDSIYKEDDIHTLPPATNFPLPVAKNRRSRKMGAVMMFLGACALSTYFLFVSAGSGSYPPSDSLSLPFIAPFKLRTSWAQYSPYFPVEEYEDPPSHCRVTQANILQRHGARFPTTGASANILTAINKLLSVKKYTDHRLDFLHNYKYRLGHDDLVPFGALQSRIAGAVHFNRYRHLVSRDQLPFVRASGSERVVLSATNWTSGFSLASHHVYKPKLSVVLSEDLNDTLDDSMCPNAGSSDAQTNQWLLKYGPPIASRLNKQAPGANITSTDVFSLLSLCPFETVSFETLSPFCNLFSEAEFQFFEYSGDLDKYYNTGYGQPLGPVQGVGYVNELLARLTGTPVRDNTQTNRTLDSSPVTFPLKRTIYADFSHDNQMIAIYAAMGLFRQRVPPNPLSPRPDRNWLSSHLVPFSAQMITERLVCGGRHGGDFVRIFVSDALQPLEFCGAGKDGLCKLDAFVKSQGYSRHDGEGDFEKCFG